MQLSISSFEWLMGNWACSRGWRNGTQTIGRTAFVLGPRETDTKTVKKAVNKRTPGPLKTH